MGVIRSMCLAHLCLFGAICAGCASEPTIRVRLVHTVDCLTFAPQGEWVIHPGDSESRRRALDAAATPVTTRASRSNITLLARGGAVTLETEAGIDSGETLVRFEPVSPDSIMEIKDVPYGVGWWWEGTQDRTYRGRLEVRPAPDGMLEVVLSLPLEEYLKGVVPSEIGADSPMEALKAQAVAARSEALLALESGKYAGEYHDIGSDVDSQAYTGNVKRTEASDAAVRATRGLALYFDGKPLAAYYASSCGGHSEDIRNVWRHRSQEKGYWDVARFDGDGDWHYDLSKDVDLRRWLAADPDVYCNPNRHNVPGWAARNFRWQREVTAAELTEWVSKKKEIGRIIALRPLKRGPSGRLVEIEFVGENGVYTEGPELPIRMVFEPPLKSAAFVVDTTGPERRPDSFVIRGAGWGHGVGMCQTGAIAMAREGRTFREILQHYYPKAAIRSVWRAD
jgi:stage II sporulation protein D